MEALRYFMTITCRILLLTKQGHLVYEPPITGNLLLATCYWPLTNCQKYLVLYQYYSTPTSPHQS